MHKTKIKKYSKKMELENLQTISLIILILYIIIYTQRYSNSPVLLRGIVEGFYGTPWSNEIRIDLIKFCSEYNLNSYIYAPKDDPYHREKWRLPYPSEKMTELKNLVDISKQYNIYFIFAVSPGLDLVYQEEKDLLSMIYKLDMMYDIGIRNFAIFFDDLDPDQDGKAQAEFLNKLQNALNKKYNDIFPLITIPTKYTRKYMYDLDGNINAYTKEFSAILNKKIIVLYTGDKVVSDGISEQSFKETKNIYKRNLGIWWNYPVNDYFKSNNIVLNSKLALGPIEKLPKAKPNSIFFNPMQQPLLSKIAIATGAEYALSPSKYEPIKSWNKVIDKQFGDLAKYMKIFASHSQHMEKGRAKVGPPDGEEFYNKSHKAILDIKNGLKVDFNEIITLIDEMENAAKNLLEKLPKNILNECQLMLEQFKRIAKAGKVAVNSLINGKIDIDLKKMRQDIKNNEEKAILSELSAVLFIDEVIELFDT